MEISVYCRRRLGSLSALIICYSPSYEIGIEGWTNADGVRPRPVFNAPLLRSLRLFAAIIVFPWRLCVFA